MSCLHGDKASLIGPKRKKTGAKKVGPWSRGYHATLTGNPCHHYGWHVARLIVAYRCIMLAYEAFPVGGDDEVAAQLSQLKMNAIEQAIIDKKCAMQRSAPPVTK